MLSEKAIHYYNEGFDCGRSILLAAKDLYKDVSQETICCGKGINNGFGIGSVCSCIVVGIMLLGILNDEDDCKRKRILFIADFQDEFSNINCCYVGKNRENCVEVIEFVCNWIENN